MKKAIIILMLFGICFSQSQLSQAIELVNAEKFDEANTLIDNYLKDNSEDHRANFIKSLILTNKEDYKNALVFIEKAIALKNDKAEYYKLAGQLYEKIDKIKLAIQAWKKCQEYAKDTKLFVEAKNHLEYFKKE